MNIHACKSEVAKVVERFRAVSIEWDAESDCFRLAERNSLKGRDLLGLRITHCPWCGEELKEPRP